jgi:hypothetical protein
MGARGLRRRRRGHGDPGDHDRGAGPRLRLDVGDDADLEAGDAADHELRLRGDQAAVPAAHRDGRDPGFSYCLSEADAGSDVAAMRCRAVRDGDDYVLNGSKYWITNAGVSDTYTVFATTDPDGQGRGITCFLVEKQPGVSFPKHEDKMGLRASPTGEVVFDDVRVPAVAPHRRRGPGLHSSPCTRSTRSRPTIGAQAVGIAQGAIDFAGTYMKGRRPSADRSPTCRACASCWPTWPCAPRPRAPGLPGVRHDRRRRPRRKLSLPGGGGQVLRVRHRHERHDRRRAAARRLRLHQGVPGRAVHARRQDHADLRGDQPGPARRRSPSIC